MPPRARASSISSNLPAPRARAGQRRRTEPRRRSTPSRRPRLVPLPTWMESGPGEVRARGNSVTFFSHRFIPRHARTNQPFLPAFDPLARPRRKLIRSVDACQNQKRVARQTTQSATEAYLPSLGTRK